MKKKISTLIATIAFVFVAVVAFSTTSMAGQWSSMGGGMTNYSGFNGHNGNSGSTGGFYAGAGSNTHRGTTLAEGQGNIRSGSVGNGYSAIRSHTGVFSNANLYRHGARSNSGTSVNATTSSRGSVNASNVVNGSANSAAFRRFHH